MMIVECPTKVFFEDIPADVLRPHLEFEDERARYEYQRLKKNFYFAHQYGQEEYNTKLADLKAAISRSLLFHDVPTDRYWTYSGLGNILSTNLQVSLENKVVYPSTFPIPYAQPVPYPPRPYQTETVRSLIEARHGYAELATGLGKTYVILLLAKELGLKTLILAPSINIAEQLISFLQTHLGAGRVGGYYGTKKNTSRLITVGIGPALTRIQPGTEHYDNLQMAQVFISDEAHTLPATTFEHICLKLVDKAPYRFFLSGTCLRNDGLDLVLKGIIGRETYTMNLKEGVAKGFLAEPVVTFIKTNAASSYKSADVTKMTRKHLYNNPRVLELAAKAANLAVTQGKSVLILIDEICQFNGLTPLLKYPFQFAHGPIGVNPKTKLERVLPQYKISDNVKLVDQFNRGEFPILIGTSAVATGTDFCRNQVTIYLVGGKSEIAVRQGAIGRSTRLMPEVGKTKCHIIDFIVEDVPALERHAKIRKRIYEREIGTPVRIKDCT